MEEYVSTAITFVANHFDTVEKATSNIVGVGLTYVGIWAGKHACSTIATGTRIAYTKAKSLVTHIPEPVFARLLSHFDDDMAMTSSVNGIVYRLETGTLDIAVNSVGEVVSVKDKGYDVYPDLTSSERKVVNRKAKAKTAEVTERDRLARRAALSAPKTV
jgi:hypothetical protein